MRLVPVKQRTMKRPQGRGRPRSQALRDFAAMERRRMQAADLFEQQVIPAEIAGQLGVTHQIVSDWRKAWQQGGREALRSAGPAGRKSKLTDEQLAAVEDALTSGAEANGFANDLWALPRVAEVIARVTGVSYHPGHSGVLLRDQLDSQCHRPARSADERNEATRERCVTQRLPHVQKH